MASSQIEVLELISSSLQVSADSDLILQSIPYDREALDEIIEELKMRSDVKGRLSEYLEYIEQQVSELKKYQAKRHPENFYQAMRTAVLSIRNTATAIYELTKNYHQTLPNTLKELILKWITPLEAELEKRIEMPVSNRDELDLKTKHLYAEQSFISRQAPLQQTLMRHLGFLKELLLVSGNPAPCCYISYAWPSEQHKAQEYWVQPFLFVLYDHLKAAGIRVVMDIRDNNPGDSIYRFMKQYHEGNYIILVGTESLLQKHYGKGAHAVQTELSIINNRFEQDQSQFGQSRIYPMLVSGTIKSAYPEIYDKYRTVRDARDAGYVGTLKKLIDWIYENSVKQKALEHSGLWQSFYHQYSGFPKKSSAVEQELSLGYHRQRLEFLRQDIQYQAVQAQEQTPHSQAVQAEQIGNLMKSQGTNPRFYDANGVQFQRPYTNPDFIMRQGLWDKMTSHFAQSDQQILTLTAHGLGGMGKTELAQYYYQHPPRPYTLRAWFYAETKDNLYQQYVDLAAEHPEGMKFPKETPIEEKVKQIKKWLEKQKDCLLIYDNVPDAKGIEALLPTMGKHHILITSRNAIDWPVHQILDVDVMEETEAIALICKITGYREDDSSIKKLVETLGYLPLALAQAGAYMAVKSLSIEDYLKLYQDYEPRLLTDKPVRGTKHEPIWITFDINFRALEKDCPAALETLKQASWLGFSAIPERLLSSMVQDDTKDKVLLWNDIKEQLKRYSLMRIDVGQKQLSIHPLLQAILRDRQIGQALGVVAKVTVLLNRSLDFNKDNVYYKYYDYNEEIIHTKTFLENIQKQHEELLNLEVRVLYKKIGIYYAYYSRNSERACEYLNKYLELICKDVDEKEHAETNNHLGFSKLINGNYRDFTLFDRAKKIYKNLKKTNKDIETDKEINLGIAFSLRNKGFILHREAIKKEGEGCWPEAQTLRENATKLVQKAIDIQTNLSDVVDKTDIAESYHALGVVLIAQKKYEEAEKNLEKALVLWNQAEANTKSIHPVMFVTLQSLGRTKMYLGKHLDALETLQDTYKKQRLYYRTKQHIDIGKTLHYKGEVLEKMCKYPEALETFEKALEVKREFYTDDSSIIKITKDFIYKITLRLELPDESSVSIVESVPPLVFSRDVARNESQEQPAQPPLADTLGSGFKQ